MFNARLAHGDRKRCQDVILTLGLFQLFQSVKLVSRSISKVILIQDGVKAVYNAWNIK